MRKIICRFWNQSWCSFCFFCFFHSFFCTILSSWFFWFLNTLCFWFFNFFSPWCWWTLNYNVQWMIASSMVTIFTLTKFAFISFASYVSPKYWVFNTSLLWSPCSFFIMTWFVPFCILVLFVDSFTEKFCCF